MNEMKDAVTNGKKTAWIVYCDRNNVQTYQSPNIKISLKKINFMDAFFVISSNDNGRLLQLVKYNADIIDFDTQRLNERYQENRDYYGWVESDKMLLWENALIDSDSRATLKAFSVFTAEMFNDLSHYVNDYTIKGYKSPEPLRSENQITPYTIYFIYKQSGNYSLIGLKENISPADANRKIAGWVPNNVINIWKHRLCLEVNTDTPAISERSSSNIEPSIFLSKEDATNFRNSNPVKPENVLMKFSNDDKWNSNKIRLPVLEIDNAGVFTTTIITDLEGNNSDLDILRNEKKEIKTNTNIVFILSGKENVRNLYSKIHLSIKDVLKNKNNKSRTESTFNTGCIIFNGESNEQCQVSPAPSELSPDLDKTINYIKNIQDSPDNCNFEQNQDETYALFPALQNATRLLKGHENDNNLFVIIGDAGSSNLIANQLDEKVINELKSLRVNFLVIQLSNPGTETYDNFYRQTKRIAEGSAALVNQTSEDYKSIKPEFELLNSSGLDMEGWDVYQFSTSTSIICGRFLFATSGASLTLNLLKDNFEYSLSHLNNLNESGESGSNNNTTNSSKVLPAIKKSLISLGYNAADPAFIKQISRYPFLLKGYSTISRTGFENNIFTQNIFLSQSEFIFIGTTMKNLTDGADLKAIRKNMETTFKNISEDYFSYKVNDPAILNKTLDDIFFMITSIHSKNENFKKYYISDLSNSKIIPDSVLQTLVNVINTKKEKFNKLLDNKYSQFEIDGKYYYWVPEDCLP